MFDYVKVKKAWREDPEASLNDNLFFGAVHFTEIFFMKYKINRHNNEHDFDDMAADCSIAVYEAAKRNIDKWDREKYRMDQYLYGRAWSVVGGWLNKYFDRKRRNPLDVPKMSGNRLTPVEYDVGPDEIGSNNYEQGTRYTVWKETSKTYAEKKLSEAAEQYLDYYDECIDIGIDPVAPEDFLTNRNSKEGDLRYLDQILNKETSPSKAATKKCRKPSLD
jgi:hypothetical protein